MKIKLPYKTFSAKKLYDELVAANINVAPLSDYMTPFSVSGNSVHVEVSDDTDPDAVASIYAAHTPDVPKAPERIMKERAAKSIVESSTENTKLRAILAMIYRSLVETRNAYNALRDDHNNGIYPTKAPELQNMTFDESQQAIIDSLLL